MNTRGISHSFNNLCLQAAPSRHLELNAMREAQAGQSASVAQLEKLLEEGNGAASPSGGGDSGDFVVLPVGRVPPAAVSTGKAGASVSSITHQATRSFLPPSSPGRALLLPQSTEGDGSIGAQQLGVALEGGEGGGWSEQDVTSKSSQPLESPAMSQGLIFSGIEGRDNLLSCLVR